jgi:hypothetical protein
MAIVLDTIVSDYLTAIKDALTTGTDTGTPGAYAGTVHAAAQNYLRAQDLATALELLMEATDTPVLTATGGSTTTFVDGASTFVAGNQVGNTVTVVTATESIVGETAVVVSNDTTTLTVSPAFSATITATDTISIQNTFLTSEIATLRDGKGIADATPCKPYANQRVAINALVRALEQYDTAVVERLISRAGLTALAGSTDTVLLLSEGTPYRIDQFKGHRATVTGVGAGIVSSSNETSVTLRGPLPSAPSGDALALTIPVDDFGGTSAPKIVTHSGPQPGENAYLADLIDQLQTVVEALTVPT